MTLPLSQPASLGSAQLSPHAATQQATCGRAEPPPHAAAHPVSLGSFEPSPYAGLPANIGSTEPSLHTTQPASLATPSATHQPVSLGRGVDLPIHAAAQPVSLSILLTRSRSNSFHTASLFLCLRMPHFRCSAPRRKLLLTNLRNQVLLVTLTILVSAEVTLKKIRQDIVTILSKLETKDSEIELLNGENYDSIYCDTVTSTKHK